VVRKDGSAGVLILTRPQGSDAAVLQKVIFTVAEQAATRSVLKQVGDTVEVTALPNTTDRYTAAVELAAVYRLDLSTIYDHLTNLYEDITEIPASYLADLARQIEEQTRNYEVREETVEVALALVKPDKFTDVKTAGVLSSKSKTHGLRLLRRKTWPVMSVAKQLSQRKDGRRWR